MTENNKDYSDWENSDEGLNTPNGGTLKYIYIYTHDVTFKQFNPKTAFLTSLTSITPAD